MKLIFFFLLSLSALAGAAQRSATDSLRKIFASCSNQGLEEKIFVHTDKAFYVSGEIVWFKIYNTDAYSHRPLSVSKICYIEIIDKRGNAVLQAKVNLENGSGNGSLQLPFSFTSGNYIVRAYTAWMKNFSAAFFFEKTITIVNTLKSTEWEKRSDSAAIDIRFFPEGGNLVNGLESTVGFKAVNEKGESISFNGALIDQNNDTIAHFRPLKFGMGKFSFTPLRNSQYKAVIVQGNLTIVRPLPAAFEQGYVMKITADKTQVACRVNSSTDGTAYLFIHNGEKIKAAQELKIRNGKAEFLLDKTELGEGISHITLFDQNLRPACERLYFIRPKAGLSINIKPDQQAYATRKKLTLLLSTGNSIGHAIPANTSLSVYRLDSLQTGETEDITSYLWFSSEIKGFVESPAYYVNDPDNMVEEATDNLMLTQGWRRFKWENREPNETAAFSFLPEYEGPVIYAHITNKMTGAPAKNTGAYLTVAGERFRLSHAVSDDSGLLRFTVNRFYGDGNLALQAIGESDHLYQISIDPAFSLQAPYNRVKPLFLAASNGQLLEQYSTAVQTQNSFTANERKRFYLRKDWDTSVFYGLPDKRYLLDNYTRFPTMEEVMREFIAEVKLTRQSDGFHFAVNNIPYQEYFKTAPLILMNGVPVWDVNKIVASDPLQIKQLDVITHRYHMGSQTYNGIVSYITYNGDLPSPELAPGLITAKYEGLQPEREYYTPVYENASQSASRIPDFRTLLYWAPQVNTDTTGRQTLTFYTSDIKGKFLVVAQGITAEGLTGGATATFEVK